MITLLVVIACILVGFILAEFLVPKDTYAEYARKNLERELRERTKELAHSEEILKKIRGEKR